MKTKGQHRGHCQVCGRIHVVESSGLVAKHGYRVADFGYFKGTCYGSDELPMELDLSVTNKIISDLTKEADSNDAYVARLRSGESRPSLVHTGRITRNAQGKSEEVTVDWQDAADYLQKREVERRINHAENQSRAARGYAKDLGELAQRVHGQPLIDRDAEELAAKQQRAAKTQPIAGAYRTKIEQKRALERLSRHYSILVRDIKDKYLNSSDRNSPENLGSAACKMYWDLPYELHQWRAKHSAAVLAVYPEHKPHVEAIELLVIQRNEIKSRPVIK